MKTLFCYTSMILFSSHFFVTDLLLVFEIVGTLLLNCGTTYCWKVLELSSARSLSHPELYMAEIRPHAAKPKLEIWGMSELFLSPRGLCLIKVAILWREQAMFLASPLKTSTVPKREIELKLPSHNAGSAGWSAWYRMAKGSRLGVVAEGLVSLTWVCVSFWSRGTLSWGMEEQLLLSWSAYDCCFVLVVREGVSSNSTSMLFCASTRSV